MEYLTTMKRHAQPMHGFTDLISRDTQSLSNSAQYEFSGIMAGLDIGVLPTPSNVVSHSEFGQQNCRGYIAPTSLEARSMKTF